MPAKMKKPPRERIEFYLPQAVVSQIRTRAERQGVTHTILLMEVLQGAGFRVREADFIDKRVGQREPRRNEIGP